MFKKLPLALIMGAALTASNALALGVGDIKVNSALNQPLSAEIELISSVEGELDDVTVQLATPDAFERINLARPYHLTSIKFKVTTRADGTPIVKLTSSETIREPFLDFLVEVNWPKGRMLREYTVLLDPPLTMAAPKPSRKMPAGDGKPTLLPEEQPSPTDVVGTDDLGYPVYAGDEQQPSAAVSGDTFGPVEAQQTLWSIADQVRPAGVSTQQMMLALFDANPDAFIDGDIHHIKKGAVLRIPDQATIESRDRADAIAQVRQINASLDLAPTAETTAEVPGIPEEVAATEPEPPAEIEAPVSEPEGELKIIGTGDAASAATASTDVEGLKRELALATETMSSQKMENDELKSRIQELEATVSEMDKLKRLLEVQNKEMKQLQEQLAASQVAPGAEPVEVMEAPEPEPLSEPEPVSEPEPAPVEEAEPVAEVEPAPEPEPAPVEEPEPVAEVEPAPEPAAEPAPVPIAPPAPKEPLDIIMGFVKKLTSDPMLLSIVGGVLLVVIALIALVFKRRGKQVEEVGIVSQPAEVPAEAKPSMFAGLKEKLQGLTKKKEKAEEPVEEEMPEEVEAEETTDPGVSAAAAAAVAAPAAAPEPMPEDATIFEAPAAAAEEPAADLSDMMFEEDESQPSPEEAIMPEEPAGPDPLEEVDVYEAFGDYEQAAEIVKQAIADYPDNNAYKLRLFKVYESGGMVDEYAQAGVEYKDAMADSPEWGEVEQTGKTFAPDSAAWGGAGGAPVQSEAKPASEAGVDMASTMAMDISAAAEVSAAAAEPAAEPKPSDTDEIDFGDLDFELGGDQAEEAPAAEEAAPSAMEAESTQAVEDGGDSNELEFDLGDMDFESAEKPEPAAEEPAAAETADDAGLEFDLGDFEAAEPEAEAAAEEAPAAKTAEDDNALEFDLGDMDFETAEAPAEEAEAETESEMSMDFELDEGSPDTEELKVGTDTVALNISAEELEAAATAAAAEAAEETAPASEDPTVMFSEEEPAAEEKPEESLGVDLSDFSFDLEESGSSEALDIEAEAPGSEDATVFMSEEDDSLGQSLSGEGDEVSTKLDLARAYIDMGDSEGAKGILQEVIAEGNDEQKAEAEELLKSA